MFSKAYLFKIISNAAKTYVRDTRAREDREVLVDHLIETDSCDVLGHDYRVFGYVITIHSEDVALELDILDDERRTVLLAHDGLGMTYEEIAARLGTTADHVRYVRRGRSHGQNH